MPFSGTIFTTLPETLWIMFLIKWLTKLLGCYNIIHRKWNAVVPTIEKNHRKRLAQAALLALWEFIREIIPETHPLVDCDARQASMLLSLRRHLDWLELVNVKQSLSWLNRKWRPKQHHKDSVSYIWCATMPPSLVTQANNKGGGNYLYSGWQRDCSWHLNSDGWWESARKSTK